MSRMSDSPDIAHLMQQLQGSSHGLPESAATPGLLPNGKKTKGRVKIKMEYIGNKLRRYTTFSKRKTGIMKKAYELSTLTGTQVMLLVASETGHVYTYATKKLQPMISSDAGKGLIQSCLNAPGPGEGTDLQPSRTEFTFETGTAPSNPRKRKMNEPCDPTAASIASFLPTMVPTALFSSFNEDDYNREADSGDDSDSEEPSEGKESSRDAETPAKDQPSPAELTASLQQTLKEALRVAANNRQQQQKRARTMPTPTPPPQQPQSQQRTQFNHNTMLAPFLLSGLTSQTSNPGVFQLPQGCVYTSASSPMEGGANANGLFVNSSKAADEAITPNPMLSFPFPFNLQQLMESAALGAQITNTE